MRFRVHTALLARKNPDAGPLARITEKTETGSGLDHRQLELCGLFGPPSAEAQRRRRVTWGELKLRQVLQPRVLKPKETRGMEA